MNKSFYGLRLLRSSASVSSIAAALWLSLGNPAVAQEAPEEVLSEPLPGPDVSDGLSSIVVTAERRTSDVQRSSMAIDVVGADELVAKGVSQAEDLARLVPGLEVATSGSQTNVYLRGVGTNTGNSASAQSVAFNVDGVYIARASALSTEFYDLERVEVLKGPQGTLYGRNAAAGAVNLISAKPNWKLEARAALEVGNYDAVRGEAAVNVPISDSLALRAAGLVAVHGGYLSDGTDDEDTQAARLMLNFDSGGGFDLLLKGGVAHQGGKGAGAVLLPLQSGWEDFMGLSTPEVNAYIAANPVGGLLPRRPFDNDMFLENDTWNVSAEANVDLGFATLTLLPAYRHQNLEVLNYNVGQQNTQQEINKQVSLETRLGRDYGDSSWVIGAYYFKEQQDVFVGVDFGFQLASYDFEYDTESYAIFGQGALALNDRLRMIGGLRYTSEDQTLDGIGGIASFVPFLVKPPYSMANALSDDSITWKVGVEYDAGSRSMLYATAATGFKAGGFDLTQVRKYDAEKLLSFELGSKNRFFGNTLQLNVSAFYWIYKDHQDQYLRMVDGAPSVFTYNAERVRIYGVDVEIEYQPTAADNVHFAVEYLNSQYTDFAFETGGPFNPVSTTCSLSGPNGPLITLDCAGRPLARAPKWSGTAGYSHSFFLSDGGAIKLGGDLRFASERFLNQNFMPGAGEDEGYLVANAEAGYTFPGDKVVIAGFVRNLTNEVVYTGGLTTAIPGEFVAQVAAPRTYGVRAAVAF